MLLLLYPETSGNGCPQFNSPSVLSHFPLIYHKFETKVIHQRVKTNTLAHITMSIIVTIVIIAMLT